MSNRNFSKGYKYQDLLSSVLIAKSFFLRDDVIFTIDSKDNVNNDIVDDLKISYANKKICFQIKYSKDKVLSSNDFKKDGQLDLNKIIEYDFNSKDDITYCIIVKWKSPTDSLSSVLLNKAEIIPPLSNLFGKPLQFNISLIDTIISSLSINKKYE